MFHWSTFVTYDASKFHLFVPLPYIAVLIYGLASLLVLAFTVKAGHPFRNWSIVLGLFAFLGFLGYSSELVLDKSTGTATVREFQFFHWSVHTYSLSQINRLYVSTGSTTSQIRLQFEDGGVYSISSLDQNGGKEEAVFAANKFLGSSGQDR